jgi:hypothetical protein
MRRAILSTLLATSVALSAGASQAEESAAGAAPFVVAVLATPATAAPVAYTKRKPASFHRMTISRAGPAIALGSAVSTATGVGLIGSTLIGGAFGAAGGVVDMVTADRMVAKNGVEDPAGVIGLALARSLAAALDARPADAPVTVDDEKPAEIAALAAPARYVIDVKTTDWGYMYQPFGWTSYDLDYKARVRLIDTASNTVAAEDKCHWESDDSPSGSELVDNGAEGLKRRMETAAATCVEQFVGVLRAQPGFGSRIQAPRLALRSQSTFKPSQLTSERFAGYRLR